MRKGSSVARRQMWVVGLLTGSVLGVLCQVPRSAAATVSWAAPVDGVYTVGTNWVGNIAPTATDNPVFGVDGAYTVTFSQAISSYSFQVNAGAVQFEGGSNTYTAYMTSTIATLPGQTATLTLGSGNFNTGALGEWIVGRGGDGTLIVSGANLTSGTVHVGGTFGTPAPDGTGRVVITGSGSEVDAAAFHVGVGGTGSVDISNGGRVSISEQSVIGLFAGVQGSVTVSDVDSQYDVPTLHVGGLGTGVMTFEQGAAGSGANWTVGYAAGGSGTLTVDGASAISRSTVTVSIPSATANLWVGYQGSGVMHVTNGALTSVAGNLSIGTATGGTGVLDVGGTAAGYSATVTAQALWIGGPSPTQYPSSGGTGKLDVNTGGVVTISGGSSVGGKGGTGTVVLNGGTLQTGNLQMMTGGALDLRSGILEVNAGDLVMPGTDFALAAEDAGSSVTLRLKSAPGGRSTFARTGDLFIGGDAQAAGNAGVLELQAGGLATIGGTTTLWGPGTLLLNGGTLQTAGLVNAGGTITWNSGTLALTGDLLLDASGPLGASVDLSAGPQNLSVAGQLAMGPGVTLTLQGGTLTAGSAVLAGGSFMEESGALMLTQSGLEVGSGQLLGSQVTLVRGQSVTVAGDVTVDAGASLTLQGGVLAANTIVSHGTFQFLSGTLSLGGDVGVDADGLFGPTLTLGTGQTLIVGGTLQVGAGGLIDLNGGRLSAAGLTNAGTITGSAAGSLTLGAGGLTNDGTLRKTGTGSLVLLGGPLANAGSVLVEGGTLVAPGVSGNGSITVSAGAILSNAGNWTLDGGSLSNAGTIQLVSGATVVSTPLTMTGGWDLAGGTLDVESSMEIGSLTLRNVAGNPISTGLTVGAGETLTVDGVFNWSGQAIMGSGTVDAKGGITLATSYTKTLSGILTNEGSAVWATGTLALGGGTINNLAGATFEMRASSQSRTAVTVNNAGTLIKSTSTGTVELGVVNNTGAVQVKQGKLVIDSGSLGGTLSVDAPAVLTLGTLTVTGAVSGAGEVDLATSAATTVMGAFAPTRTVVGTNAKALFASGADLTGMGDLVTNAGSVTTLETGSAVTMANMTVGGEVDVLDPLNVTGTLSLVSGGKLVLGDTLLLGGAEQPGQLTWTGGMLDVSHGGISGVDTVTIPSSGVMVIDETGFAGTIVVNGELDIVQDGQLVAAYTGGDVSVPEAGTLGILAVGGLALIRRRAGKGKGTDKVSGFGNPERFAS